MLRATNRRRLNPPDPRLRRTRRNLGNASLQVVWFHPEQRPGHAQDEHGRDPLSLAPPRDPNHICDMKKDPFRLTPYQVQWLMVVGFVTVGYALYVRYLAIELSTVTLACDAGLQSYLCKARAVATYLFRNSVFGIVALIVAVLHVIRPSIVLLTVGLVAAGAGIVLYNVALSGIAVGLLILGFARPAPATV
jgi:hypothetical protein